MKKLLLVLFLCSTSVKSHLHEPYCMLPCANEENLACTCETTPKCPLIEDKIGNFRVYIWDQLNRIRSHHAYAQRIANMHQLHYNKELEFLAKCAVSSCKMARPSCLRSLAYDEIFMTSMDLENEESYIKKLENYGNNFVKNETFWQWADKYLDNEPPENSLKEAFGHAIRGTHTNIGCYRAKMNQFTRILCVYSSDLLYEDKILPWRLGGFCSSCDKCSSQYMGLCI